MTTKPAGIAGAGVALPALRVTRESHAEAWGTAPRAIERRATVAWDEDETTLAVEAARRALAASGVDVAEVGLVLVATTGPARAASVVAEAVGARAARTLDVAGDRTAGVAALVTAFDTVAAAGNVALVVAADAPRAAPGAPGEAEEGAAAAALVVAPGGAVTLAAAGAASRDLPGAAVADLADPGLARLAVAGEKAFEAPAAFLVAAGGPDVAWVQGAKAAPSLRARVGDAGAALPLLDLVAALASAPKGAGGLLVAQDGGRALALRLDVAAALPPVSPPPEALAAAGRVVPYFHALRERRALVAAAGFPDQPMGAYVSFPEFARSLHARYRLVASRCASCNRLAFPPRAACPACGKAEWTDAPLSGRGVVHTFTTIARGGAPSEFAAEQAMTGDYATAVVELEEGPRVAARLTDVAPSEVAIGMKVEAVLRRLYEQQGVVRYGFKFRRMRA